MKRDVDLVFISRIIFLSILTIIIGYTFYNIVRMDEANLERQAEQIEQIIQKAAVQCYALEGSYPGHMEYLAKYGVILNEDRFFYRYETNGLGNYRPQIFVTPR